MLVGRPRRSEQGCSSGPISASTAFVSSPERTRAIVVSTPGLRARSWIESTAAPPGREPPGRYARQSGGLEDLRGAVHRLGEAVRRPAGVPRTAFFRPCPRPGSLPVRDIPGIRRVIKYLGSKRRLVQTLSSLASGCGAATAADLFTGTTRRPGLEAPGSIRHGGRHGHLLGGAGPVLRGTDATTVDHEPSSLRPSPSSMSSLAEGAISRKSSARRPATCVLRTAPVSTPFVRRSKSVTGEAALPGPAHKPARGR